jgi:carboxypeptidase A4
MSCCKFLLFLVFSLLLVTLSYCQLPIKQQLHAFTEVIKVQLSSAQQVDLLQNLDSQGTIDLWHVDSYNLVADVAIPLSSQPTFKRTFLSKYNLTYSVSIPNLQTVIDKEQEEMKKFPYQGNDTTFFDNFRKYEDIMAFMEQKVRQHPNLASFIKLEGKSYEGQEIIGLKIHNRAIPTPKGTFLFHGGIHAREWISPSTVLWIMNELLTKSESDTSIKRLTDNLEFHVFPVFNVDGYRFTHTTNRMWRKSRSPNPSRPTCIGTDLNRNWDFKWNSGGSSNDPCSEVYHGSKAFSEVETRLLSAYSQKLPNLLGYIDYHAFGQLVMRPWGYTREDPADEPRMKRYGDAIASEINKVRGRPYRSGKFATILYVGAGTTVDWFYGIKPSVTNAFCIELSTAFIVSPAEIRPVGRENFEGFKQFGTMLLSQ